MTRLDLPHQYELKRMAVNAELKKMCEGKGVEYLNAGRRKMCDEECEGDEEEECYT